MRSTRLFAFVIIAAGASELSSQSPAELPPEGPRIRVLVPVLHQGAVVRGTDRWTVGTLVSVDGGELVMRVPDEESEVTVPLRGLRKLQVSEGISPAREYSRRSAVRGAVLAGGLMAGFNLMLGGAWANNGAPPEEPCRLDCELRGMTWGSFARNVTIAAGVGALIGHTVGSRDGERWRTVRASRAASLLPPSTAAAAAPPAPSDSGPMPDAAAGATEADARVEGADPGRVRLLEATGPAR